MARAENYGLLVGISGYPMSTGYPQLPGARNDILLMQRVLARKGFDGAHIKVLADQIEGAQAPTRANILGALDALVEKVQAGDLVYLHFSGHGAQQPATRLPRDADPEPDGLSEIFLPIDVGGWDSASATVKNAIIDHELVAWLRRAMAKGVRVWAVFDACHSATLMRGSSPDAVIRGVSAATLGIPEEAFQAGSLHRGNALPANQDGLGATYKAPPNGGGYVSFYAAQPWQSASEMSMPRGAIDGYGRPHGVLTYTLAEALESTGGVSYRQLGDYLLQRYAVESFSAQAVPVYSGTLLDSPVLGGLAGPAVRQWPVRVEGGKVFVSAGQLSEVGEGARLILVPSPVAPDDAASAAARVVRAEPFAAELEVSALDGGKPALLPDERSRMVARLVQPGIRYMVRVARPSSRIAESPAARRIIRAVDGLVASGEGPSRVAWVPTGAAADIALTVDGDCLWFVPAAGESEGRGACGAAGGTSSMKIPESEAQTRTMLDDRLATMARARGLLRAVQAAQSLGRGAQPEVEFGLMRRGDTEARPWPRGENARLHDGDLVTIRFENTTEQDLDVTVLYVDSAYGIEGQYPRSNSDNRVRRKEVFDSQRAFVNKGIRISDSTVGVEHILVLLEPASDQPRKDYSYLAQAGIGPAPTRSAGSISGFGAYLEEAAGIVPVGAVRGARQVYNKGFAAIASIEVAPGKHVEPGK